MAEENPAVAGFKVGQDLVSKAIENERQMQDLQAKKEQLNVSKFNVVMEDMGAVLSQPHGKLRDYATKRMFAKAQQMNYVIDPGIADVLNDPEMQVPLSQNLAAIMGLSNPKEIGVLADRTAPLFADPLAFKTKTIELAAQLQAKRSKEASEGQSESSKQIDELRRERSQLPITKNTQVLVESFQRMQSVVNEPSAAGDLSLVFSYMKVLDPNSTVREGEQAQAANAAGVPERARALYNKILTGERLTPEQRSDFMGQARNMYEAQLVVQGNVDRQYKQIAEQRGLDPNAVNLGFAVAEQRKRNDVAYEMLRKKGYSDEQIKALVEKRKSERANVLEPAPAPVKAENTQASAKPVAKKGSANAQSRTAK